MLSCQCHYGVDLGTLSAIYLYDMSMFPALNAINNGGDEKIPIVRVLGRRRLYVGIRGALLQQKMVLHQLASMKLIWKSVIMYNAIMVMIFTPYQQSIYMSCLCFLL